jgi:hypothetical protein
MAPRKKNLNHTCETCPWFKEIVAPFPFGGECRYFPAVTLVREGDYCSHHPKLDPALHELAAIKKALDTISRRLVPRP